MALLNPPQILPNLAEVIYRFLLQAERHQERRQTLVALLAPPSLEQNLGSAGSKGLDDTLRACGQIRLIESDGEVLRLHSSLPDWSIRRKASRSSFRRLMRQLVLMEGLNHGEWGSQEGSRDLSLGLAWFLRQDIYSPPGTWDKTPPLPSAQDEQLRQFGSVALIVNDTRWGSFSRWSTFLGFAVHHAWDDHSYLVPDPTEAVRDLLDIVCEGPRGDIALPSLVAKLGDLCPVLDTGAYRREIESHLVAGQFRQIAPGNLTPSLGHALRRLEAENLIRLTDRADAPKVEFASESGQRVVRSHLSWTPAVHRGGNA